MKPRSGAITDGPSRAPARAMLKAVGFSDADLRKPIIGVANTWIEIGPCNYHLRTLAEYVKGQHPQSSIILADKKVEHGKVISIIDLLKANGVQKFSFGVEKN